MCFVNIPIRAWGGVVVAGGQVSMDSQAGTACPCPLQGERLTPKPGFGLETVFCEQQGVF